MIQLLSQLLNRLEVLVILLLVTGVLFLINSIDGAIMSATIKEFSWTRFWKSMLKCLLIFISTIALWFSIELIMYALDVIQIELPSDVITFIEIVTMIVGVDVRYAKEIFIKLQTLLNGNNNDSCVG